MTHGEIIRLSDGVETESGQLSYIRSFSDDGDMEVAALLCAWDMNDGTGNIYPVQKLIEERMGNAPMSFVAEYTDDMHDDDADNSCFHRTLTYGNLHAMLQKMHAMIREHGSILGAVVDAAVRKRSRYTYTHEALCHVLSGGTGLPSGITNGTFFRYYLYVYWMVYKLGVWDSVPLQVLIPCDDQSFNRAFDLGLTKKHETSTLRNAVFLTKKAKKIFGDDDFYRLYEVLNLHEDAAVKRIY